MNELDELRRPLTEIERAELVTAVKKVSYGPGIMLLRRALFQLDASQSKASIQKFVSRELLARLACPGAFIATDLGAEKTQQLCYEIADRILAAGDFIPKEQQ